MTEKLQPADDTNLAGKAAVTFLRSFLRKRNLAAEKEQPSRYSPKLGDLFGDSNSQITHRALFIQAIQEHAHRLSHNVPLDKPLPPEAPDFAEQSRKIADWWEQSREKPVPVEVSEGDLQAGEAFVRGLSVGRLDAESIAMGALEALRHAHNLQVDGVPTQRAASPQLSTPATEAV